MSGRFFPGAKLREQELINKTDLSVLAEHVSDVLSGVSGIEVADKQRLHFFK
jgi:hypothetical protein